MPDRPYEAVRLDEIEPHGLRTEWIPIRRHLGIRAFGVNAWTAVEDGQQIIPEHEESSIGHEELYLVLDGHARFTVGGEEVDGPPGTIVFVRDPGTLRGATAREGTTVLTVGARPGEAFRISPWEQNADVFALFDRGEFAEAKRLLEAMLAEDPQAAGTLYNLACAEAQLGEHDDALEHLGRALELQPSFAEAAVGDHDLAPLRDDPRFPA